MQRDHVRLGHTARVDPLRRLYLRQRPDAITQRGGALKLHLFRGLRHLLGQRFLHIRGFARQEPFGIADAFGVVGLRDLADTRPGAALDLVLQAGPCPAVEHGIRAIAQKKDALQLVQRPVHRARTREGAVICAFVFLRAAMLVDHRKGMIRDMDVRKRFVVPQKYVVARLELLDEVLFQQQRFGLGPRRQEHHRRGFRNHPRDAARVLR